MTVRVTWPLSAPISTRTSVPAGLWRIALSTSTRPICCTRCSSPMPCGGVAGGRASTTRLPCRAARPRNSRTRARAVRGQVDRLLLHLDRPGVEPGQVEQVGGELGQPASPARAWSAGTPRAWRASRSSLCQQLEEPGQREQRRAQLVGGVGDEVLAGAVDLREPALHEIEGPGQPAELVRGARRRSAGRTGPAATRLAADFELAQPPRDGDRRAPSRRARRRRARAPVAIRIWRSPARRRRSRRRAAGTAHDARRASGRRRARSRRASARHDPAARPSAAPADRHRKRRHRLRIGAARHRGPGGPRRAV